jgi:hypothetical protein
MQASVLIHLRWSDPADQKPAEEPTLTVRGFYGEGSEVVGNFFQISNQTTLGESEEDTLGKLSRVVKQILEWEERAEESLLRDAELQIEDKIVRALGVLRYSRLLGSQEVIGLLSAVRFGHTLGFRNVPSIQVLNDLLLRCQQPPPAGGGLRCRQRAQCLPCRNDAAGARGPGRATARSRSVKEQATDARQVHGTRPQGDLPRARRSQPPAA